MILRRRERHQRYRRGNRDLILEAKDKPCADCGIKYPFYVMHLDHLDRDSKAFSPAKLRGRGRSTVIAELAKCEAVCANCHAERSWQQIQALGGSWCGCPGLHVCGKVSLTERRKETPDDE